MAEQKQHFESRIVNIHNRARNHEIFQVTFQNFYENTPRGKLAQNRDNFPCHEDNLCDKDVRKRIQHALPMAETPCNQIVRQHL